MNVLDEIRNDANGAAILADWLGSGGRPVAQHIADHRSLACVHGFAGEPCPHNASPNWWDRHVKDPVAKAIKNELAIKERLKLETPFDRALNMCKICGCCTALKVWTPIEHIAKHTSASQLTKYPAFCWQRKEIEQ